MESTVVNEAPFDYHRQISMEFSYMKLHSFSRPAFVTTYQESKVKYQAMQHSSQKYSSYHKSFDRAFNTRQGTDTIDFEEVTLPPLQTGELVTMPMHRTNQAATDGKNIAAKHRIGLQEEKMNDLHLKPVVLREARGISFENFHKVRLPPININLKAREVVNPGKWSQKAVGSPPKHSALSSKYFDISDNNDQRTSGDPGDDNQRLVYTELEKEPFQEPNENDGCHCTAAARTNCTTSRRSFHGRMGIIERTIAMNEYSVLPPIGKQTSMQKKVEQKLTGVEAENVTAEKDSITNSSEMKLGLEEALENLANDYEVLKGSKPTENENATDKNEKSRMQLSTGKSESSDNNRSFLLYEEQERFTEIEDTSQTTADSNDIKSKSNKKKECKRKRNYYKDPETIEDESERRLIRKTRKRGRRFAICEEMDTMYRDLAVIVKHNLLIQHLEEICIF